MAFFLENPYYDSYTCTLKTLQTAAVWRKGLVAYEHTGEMENAPANGKEECNRP